MTPPLEPRERLAALRQQFIASMQWRANADYRYPQEEVKAIVFGNLAGYEAMLLAHGVTVAAPEQQAAGEHGRDFREVFRSERDKAIARGLTQEAAHELALFAVHLNAKPSRRAALAPRAEEGKAE